MIKVGKFGLFSKDDFDNASLSNPFTPIPDRPRIYISGTAFGSDPQILLFCIRKDGSNEANACTTFVGEAFSKSSRFTEMELPVKLSFFTLAYPVTTTSSKSSVSGNILIEISLPKSLTLFKSTSCDFIPTKEKINTIVSRLGNSILNFPSISVTTPTAVPFKSTVTPGRVSPRSSTTFPCTVTFFISSFLSSGVITIRLSTILKVYFVPAKQLFRMS